MVAEVSTGEVEGEASIGEGEGEDSTGVVVVVDLTGEVAVEALEEGEEALEEGEEDKLYVPAENNVTENKIYNHNNLPIEKIQNYFED